MRSYGWALSAVLCLGLVACSDATDPDPDPTTAHTDATDPDPDPTTGDPDPTPFDPCSLIPREEIERLGLYRADAGEQFEGLSLGTEHVVDCRVDSHETFVFGYKDVGVEDEVWELLGTTPPDENPGLEPVDGLGDEAYYTAQGPDRRLAVRVGDEQLFLRDSTGQGVSREEILELGQTMVENIPTEIVRDPYDLPDACPSIDDEAVTSLVGGVMLARGTQDRGSLSLMCRYLGEGDTRINAEILALTPENAQDLVDSRAERSDEVDVEGRTVYVDDGVSDTSLSLASADEDGAFASIDVSALVGGEDYEQGRGPEREAGLALMTALLAAHP